MEKTREGNTVIFVFVITAVNFVLIALTTAASLLLNPFFYDEKRTEFTQRRLGPASIFPLFMFGVVVNRGILREFANHTERRATKTALDILACFATFISCICGVLIADIYRQWQEDGE